MSGDTLLSIVQDDVSDDYRRQGAAAELARREKYKAAEQSVRDNEDDKMDIDKDIMDEAVHDKSDNNANKDIMDRSVHDKSDDNAAEPASNSSGRA